MRPENSGFLNASFRHLLNALFSKVDSELFSLERSGGWKVVAQEVSDFQYGQRILFSINTWLPVCKSETCSAISARKVLDNGL